MHERLGVKPSITFTVVDREALAGVIGGYGDAGDAPELPRGRVDDRRTSVRDELARSRDPDAFMYMQAARAGRQKEREEWGAQPRQRDNVP